MERNLSNISLSPASSCKLKLSSTTTNFKSAMHFNESSFMSKLKNMYEKRNVYKPIPFNVKKFTLSPSTLDTEDDNNKKNNQMKIITRNQSEKILVHPFFRQQQKYLTSKIQTPSSTPKNNLHPIFLSPTSIKNINNNHTLRNFHSNDNSVKIGNTNSTINTSPKQKINIHKLLYQYIKLVLQKVHNTKNIKQNEPSIYPYTKKQPTMQSNIQQLCDKESQTPRCSKNNQNNLLIDKQIVEIFSKLPFPLQKQINEMLHLKIHVKYCENMFDSLNRKLDIRDNTNNPISDKTAIESNLYKDMIDFIYYHKTNYSKHNDFTIMKEITPENMYIQSIREKHKQICLDADKNKENIPKTLYSSKNELINIRNKRKIIQDIIDKSMKEGKVREKKFKELNEKRLNYFLIKEANHSTKQIKNTQRNTIETGYPNKQKITFQQKSKLQIYTKINNPINIKKVNHNNDKNSLNDQINNVNSTISKQNSIIQNYSSNNTNTNNIVISNNNTVTTCCVNDKAMSDRPPEIIRPEELIASTNDEQKQSSQGIKRQRVADNKLKYQRQQKAKQTIINQLDNATKKKEENDFSVADKDLIEKIQKYKNEQKQIRALRPKRQTLLEPRILHLANLNKVCTKNYFLEGTEQDKEYKMKELRAFKLSQEINYFLSVNKPKTENEKNLFEEFKEKINSLKQVNDEIYISYINDNYEYLQEELENLKKIRESEKQINDFIFHLNNDIQNNSMQRHILGEMIRFKDTEVIGQEYALHEKDYIIEENFNDN